MATGIGVNRVDFVITGSGGYTKTISDTNSADGWSGVLDGISAGSYQVKAIGTKGATTVYSSPVSFTVAP